MSSVLCGVCPVVVRASAPGAPRSPLTTSAPFPIHSGEVRRRGVHLGSTSGRGSSTVRMALPKEAVDAGFVAADMSSVLCGVCPVVVRASAPGAPRSPLTTSAPFPIHSGEVRRRGVHLGSTSGRGSSTVRMALPKEAVDAGFVAADAEVPTFAAQSMSDALEGTGVEPWQLWFGLWIGLSPFVIAAYEFGKRILIQRQCELCSGSGLIQKGRYARKCTSCGGFLPWQSWGQFFTSEAGNGGGGAGSEGTDERVLRRRSGEA